MAKYGNRKTLTSDGILHDSRKEALRWTQLQILWREGVISDLRRQVEFLLIPDQREPSTEVYQKGEKKGMPKQGNLLERKVVYVADFVYNDMKTGKRVVECFSVRFGIYTHKKHQTITTTMFIPSYLKGCFLLCNGT